MRPPRNRRWRVPVAAAALSTRSIRKGSGRNNIAPTSAARLRARATRSASIASTTVGTCAISVVKSWRSCRSYLSYQNCFSANSAQLINSINSFLGGRMVRTQLGLLKRLGILAVLVCCLGFVATNSHAVQLAAPCCQDCAVPPFGEDPTAEEYCENKCGASSGSCYTVCLNQIHNCWAHCIFC